MTSFERRLHWLGCLVAIVAMALSGAGCKAPPRGIVAKPSGPTPTYRELAQAQNDRVAKLREVYARGVIELRWKDSSGRHLQQGDMELWIKQPRHTAVRVETLGEVLFWLGSDDERYWLFDMVSKEKTLVVGRHDEPLADEQGGAFGVKPLALLDLMGLSALPWDLASDPTVLWGEKIGAWSVTAPGSGGLMRMYFDRMSKQPVRVETLDAQGRALVFSTLNRYDSAKLTGVSELAYPKLAFLVDIASAPGARGVEGGAAAAGDDREGQLKIAIGEATGSLDPDEAARVFDLPRLMKGMRPDRIEGEVPDAPIVALPAAAPGAANR